MAFDYLPIQTFFEETPPARDDVLPGLAPRTVSSLMGPGGVSKSFLVTQIGCCIAAGANDFMGIWRGKPFHAGQVLYLAGEDPPVEFHRRLHAIARHWVPSDRDAIYERLHIADRTGRLDNDLFDDRFLGELCAEAAGHRLVVIDTLRRFHRREENDSGPMSELVSRLEWLAREAGPAVIVTHHVSKSAALLGNADAQQAGRGSSVLTDNMRWQANLVTMDPEEAEKYGVDKDARRNFVRLCLPKANYIEATADLWLRRSEGGVLVAAHLSEADGKRKREAEKRKAAREGRDEV